MRAMPVVSVALVVLAVASAAPAPAWAQAAEAASPGGSFRWGLGLGAGTGGLSIAVDAGLERSDRLYRARLTTHDNVAASWSQEYRERRTVTELGLLVGRGQRLGRNHGSVSGGLAMVAVDQEERSRGTLGIPVEAQLISGRRPHLGVSALANLNPEASFAAFVLSVQFGRMP